MIHGIVLFHCSECGKRFTGPAIEHGATACLAPAKCPRCGSWQTRTWSPVTEIKYQASKLLGRHKK